MPTDSRTMSSPMPAAASCAALICWCVVLAGWITRVLASPTFARWLARRSDSMNLAPAARPPLYAEADHRTRAARQQPSRQLVVRVIRQTRMQYPGDCVGAGAGTRARPRCSPCGARPAGSRSRRLAADGMHSCGDRHTPNCRKPSVRARITKCRRPELFGEHDALIARHGLRQRRVFSGASQSNRPPSISAPPIGDAVAADPLGDRVHHDVGAQIERAAQIGVAKVLSISSGMPGA